MSKCVYAKRVSEASIWYNLDERLMEVREAGPSASLFIDALDVIAEDHSQSAGLRLFRSLLKLIKELKRE